MSLPTDDIPVLLSSEVREMIRLQLPVHNSSLIENAVALHNERDMRNLIPTFVSRQIAVLEVMVVKSSFVN